MLCDKVMDVKMSDVGDIHKGDVGWLNLSWPPYAEVQELLPKAQKFIIEDDAAIAADGVRISHAKSLMDADGYAKLPFECCWFEWNRDAIVDSVWEETRENKIIIRRLRLVF